MVFLLDVNEQCELDERVSGEASRWTDVINGWVLWWLPTKTPLFATFCLC
jgi:hypothetical protein